MVMNGNMIIRNGKGNTSIDAGDCKIYSSV